MLLNCCCEGGVGEMLNHTADRLAAKANTDLINWSKMSGLPALPECGLAASAWDCSLWRRCCWQGYWRWAVWYDSTEGLLHGEGCQSTDQEHPVSRTIYARSRSRPQGPQGTDHHSLAFSLDVVQRWCHNTALPVSEMFPIITLNAVSLHGAVSRHVEVLQFLSYCQRPVIRPTRIHQYSNYDDFAIKTRNCITAREFTILQWGPGLQDYDQRLWIV